MLLFKVNPIDAELLTKDVYLFGCITLNNKKYITSLIGKTNFDLTIPNNCELKTPLAYMCYTDIVVAEETIALDIIQRLADNKEMYVESSITLIVSIEHVYEDVTTDLTSAKVNMVKNMSKFVDTLVSANDVTSTIELAVNIQQLIIDGKVVMNTTPTVIKDKERLIAYINDNEMNRSFRDAVDNFISQLPDDKLPTLIDIDFETISEDDIDVLNSYITKLTKLNTIFTTLYRWLGVIASAETIEELTQYEQNILHLYYEDIKLAI